MIEGGKSPPNGRGLGKRTRGILGSRGKRGVYVEGEWLEHNRQYKDKQAQKGQDWRYVEGEW